MKKNLLVYLIILVAILFGDGKSAMYGQYHYSGNIISKEINTFNTIPFAPLQKSYLGHLFVLSQIEKDRYMLEALNLRDNTLKKKLEFTFRGSIINDFIYANGELWILGDGKLYSAKDTQCIIRWMPSARHSVERLSYINDDQFLMYSIYPFHPLDGVDSLQLYIYDMKTNKLSRHANHRFEGISIANIIKNWLTIVNEDTISICDPLTGKIVSFDLDLNIIDSFILDIDEFRNGTNTEFVNFMDNEKSNTDLEILKLSELHKNETVSIVSDYYSKEGLLARMDL